MDSFKTTSHASQSFDVVQKLAQLTMQPPPSQTSQQPGLTFYDMAPEVRNAIIDFALPDADMRKGTLLLKGHLKDVGSDVENVPDDAIDIDQPDICTNSGKALWPITLLLVSRQVNSEVHKKLVSRSRVHIPLLSKVQLSRSPIDLKLPLYQSVRTFTVNFDQNFDGSILHPLRDLPKLSHLDIVLSGTRSPFDTEFEDLDRTLIKHAPTDLILSIRWPKLIKQSTEYGFFEHYYELTLDNLFQYDFDVHEEERDDWHRQRGCLSWYMDAKEFVAESERIVGAYNEASVHRALERALGVEETQEVKPKMWRKDETGVKAVVRRARALLDDPDMAGFEEEFEEESTGYRSERS